jgi:hypothetical protein
MTTSGARSLDETHRSICPLMSFGSSDVGKLGRLSHVSTGTFLPHLAGEVVAHDVLLVMARARALETECPRCGTASGQRSRELAMIARSKVTVIPLLVVAGRNPVRGPPASSARRAAMAASGCPASVRKAPAGRV